MNIKTSTLTQATDERYAQLQKKGMGRMDTSSLIEVLAVGAEVGVMVIIIKIKIFYT